MDLFTLGWNDYFAERFAPYADQGLTPARVAAEFKHLYRLYAEQGELLAEVSGKMRYQADGRSDYPAVGDWVAVSARWDEGRATIHGVLPRKSKFSRQAAGTVTGEQVVAANIDTVFLLSALDNDFNPRRIERYLTLAWESGVNPVILLNKADCCQMVKSRVEEARAVAFGVPVHPISCATGQGLEELASYLAPGFTAAALGSSGVGKSTLVNRLLGREIQRVNEVREDDSRGRHTTTYREMFFLPSGGIIIDTPGMRELQLWDAEVGLQGAFAEVEQLAARCRFSDCRHRGEPGCAVREALDNGTLDAARFESYEKLRKEMAYQRRREDINEYLAEKEKWRKISLMIRDMKK